MAGQRKKPEGKSKATKAAAEKAVAERARLRQAARPLIVRAAELIEDRSHWTKRVFARDRHSHPVAPSSERAVRFCLGGAILRAAAEEHNLRIRLPRPGESFSPIEALGIDELVEAYALVGRAIEMIFYRPSGVRIRERDGSVYRQIVIETDPAAEQKQDKTARVLTTTWSEFVHSFNDAAQIRHGDLRPALVLAALWAFGGQTTPLSEGSGQATPIESPSDEHEETNS